MRKNRETSGIKTHDVKSAKNQFKKFKKKKKISARAGPQHRRKLGAAVRTCNPNIWGAEAGSQEAGGQPGIDDIFSQKKRKTLKTLTALGWRDVWFQGQRCLLLSLEA